MASNEEAKLKDFHIPEEIVETIVACLPITVAVGLSRELSKRLKHSWKICRDVSITRDVASKFTKEEFTTFLNNFFLNFSNTNMCRFRVYFDPTNQMDLVQSWVRKAIKCGISELDLDFTSAEQTHKLSLLLENMVGLRILKLNKCELDFTPKTHVWCTLQQITLRNVKVPLFTCQVIFATSLNLKTIEFIHCNFFYNLEIFAHDLKMLDVLVVKHCRGLYSLRIDAPSLQTFHYYGTHCVIEFESRPPYLRDVVLDIFSAGAIHLFSRRYDGMISLANVTKLAMNHILLESLCARFDHDEFKRMKLQFWRLKEFYLFVGEDSYITPLDVVIFLERCPRLERLTIELGKNAFADSMSWEIREWKYFQQFTTPFPFMRFVKIRGFTLKDMNVSLARFFIKNAQYLHGLEIVRARNDMSSLRLTPERLAKGLSTNAKIEIYESTRDESAILSCGCSSC